MSLKFGYFTEELKQISINKLSAVRIYLEAQKRGHETFYFNSKDLFYSEGELYARAAKVDFFLGTDVRPQYEISEKKLMKVSDLDIFFMRKDPPVNNFYVSFTYMLESLEQTGKTLFVNSPRGIRNSHSKLLTLKFPDFIAPTLISSSLEEIISFIDKYKKCVIKPLDGRGGQGILILESGDTNLNSLIEMMLTAYSKSVMVQKYLPEAASEGDKRIIMFDGEPVGAILRKAADGDFRSNISAGASFVKSELTDREKEMCEALKPYLLENGLFFVGLDVIGGCITEINATSPGMLAPANIAYGMKFEELFWDKLEQKLGYTK